MSQCERAGPSGAGSLLDDVACGVAVASGRQTDHAVIHPVTSTISSPPDCVSRLIDPAALVLVIDNTATVWPGPPTFRFDTVGTVPPAGNAETKPAAVTSVAVRLNNTADTGVAAGAWPSDGWTM